MLTSLGVVAATAPVASAAAVLALGVKAEAGVAATLVATVGGSPVEVALSTPVLINLRSRVWVWGTVS